MEDDIVLLLLNFFLERGCRDSFLVAHVTDQSKGGTPFVSALQGAEGVNVTPSSDITSDVVY